MELTFWTAGINFSINLDLVLGLISALILVLTFNPVFSINLAGVNFLILNDAQGPIGCSSLSGYLANGCQDWPPLAK